MSNRKNPEKLKKIIDRFLTINKSVESENFSHNSINTSSVIRSFLLTDFDVFLLVASCINETWEILVESGKPTLSCAHLIAYTAKFTGWCVAPLSIRCVRYNATWIGFAGRALCPCDFIKFLHLLKELKYVQLMLSLLLDKIRTLCSVEAVKVVQITTRFNSTVQCYIPYSNQNQNSNFRLSYHTRVLFPKYSIISLSSAYIIYIFKLNNISHIPFKTTLHLLLKLEANLSQVCLPHPSSKY